MRKHYPFFSLLIVSILITLSSFSQDLIPCASHYSLALINDWHFHVAIQYICSYIANFHAIVLNYFESLISILLKSFSSLDLILILISLVLLVFIPVYLCMNEWIKSKLVKEQNNRLIRIEKELRLLDSAKNKFISIMSHDLKDLLHTIKGYSFILASKYGDFTEEEKSGYSKEIYSSTEQAIRLLQNMMNWSLLRSGQIELRKEKFDLRDLIDDILPFFELVAKSKKINLTYDLSTQMDVMADPFMIESALRNLISNALKFTSENGTVTITCVEHPNEFDVCVEDNGIGISYTDAEKIFRIDSKVKYKGTNDEEGSGIGLILTKEFIEKNGGRISFESQKGKGSKFYISIPRYIDSVKTN